MAVPMNASLPTFSDFFFSFYHSNTYLPAVDLTERGLSKYLLEAENSQAADIAQKLISTSAVRSVLSEPLVYDPQKIEEKNKVLSKAGFRLLGSKLCIGPSFSITKMPFYSVIEHRTLPNWVIKSGAVRIPEDQFVIGPMNDKNEMALFVQEESILRIEMANRVAKIAKEADIDVVIPKKRLVAYANSDGVKDPTKKYCVICEKIDIQSSEETIRSIKKMSNEKQREVAQKISTIVQKAGLVDATFENIRLTRAGQLAFIDTEPAGLMVMKKPGLWNSFTASGASVEKCARIGLFNLMNQVSRIEMSIQDPSRALTVERGLEAFYKQVESDYKRISTPQLSKWKIVLSIASFGILPLIYAVAAAAKTRFVKQMEDELTSMNVELATNVRKLRNTSNWNKLRKIAEEHQSKVALVVRQFFACIEGVPYSPAIP